MSDSYSAWSEERDRKAYKKECSEIIKFKKSKKWKKILSDLNKNRLNTELSVVKVCATCNSIGCIHSINACKKLGIQLVDPHRQVCNKWNIQDRYLEYIKDIELSEDELVDLFR